MGGRRITRKAYTAHRRGKTIRVLARRIRDQGAPGKWASMHGPGIGPLKEGELGKVGYSEMKSKTSRHRSLRKAVKKYGALSTFRKLNAVGTYTKRTSKGKSKRFITDRNWVKKTYM
jgi:hypothetical protein